MVPNGFDDVPLWIDLALLFSAAIALPPATWAVVREARQRGFSVKMSPVAAARRIRFSHRFAQVRHFTLVASRVVEDAESLLRNARCLGSIENYEARTMIPLVSEARRTGEVLLARRKRWHVMVSPKFESKIELAILDLIELEARLKAIPRAILSIEDVVAGRFE
jgi:hypothetical protein